MSLGPLGKSLFAVKDYLFLENEVLKIKVPETGIVKIVLPAQMDDSVLHRLHSGFEGAHLGIKKTLSRVKQRFWRPGLASVVELFCKGCLDCLRCKPRI
jgi:hypothetical protein